MSQTHSDSGQCDGLKPVQRLRPQKTSDFKAFPVEDELVLLPHSGDTLHALNKTSTAIYQLCDGTNTLSDMFRQLRVSFDGDDLQIVNDLNEALLRFRELDLLQTNMSFSGTSLEGLDGVNESSYPRRRFVQGIEDRPYFHWQLAVFLESTVGQLPPGWDVVVVVCNNHQPISEELQTVFTAYGVTHFTGASPADNHDIDFAGGGDRYVPMNRVEALNVMRQHSAPDDVICLMDSDLFLYGNLKPTLFPSGNAMTKNWIIGQEKYFQFSTQDTVGLSLPKLLEALGYEQEFKPGGVMVFLTGEALRRKGGKLVQDCFRFLQILYLSAKILDLPPHGVWGAEMACFAMAMYPNAIDYDLLEIEEFAVPSPGLDEPPQGTLCHYYADLNDGHQGPFAGSQWHKQLFANENFLLADIESFQDGAVSEAGRRFFELAIMARQRIYGGTYV